MRRRTQRLGGKRQLIYIVVIVILLAGHYLYDNYIAPHQDKISAVVEAVAGNGVPLPDSSVPDIATSGISSENSAPNSSPAAKPYRSGWAELPSATKNKDLYTAYHTSNGRRNYSVCFSRKHRCPVWVASPMHRSYKGSIKRSDNYAFDPKLPVEIQPLLKRSYGEYTRGHILGSAERTATQELNDQVFYVTNIAPQLREGFNARGGVWNNLESFTDRHICRDTLYVVTGAIFDDYTDHSGREVKASTTINKNDGKSVAVPTAFYKVLLRTKSGSSGKSVYECSASELKCAAFIVGHYSASRRTAKSDMMSVKELERLTGLNFFAGVKNAPKSQAVAEEWGL